MHTYVFRVFDCTPYILITAPTSAAGKSRIFDVAKCLVRQPYTVVDPTPAGLFHAIDQLSPTLLVDEADMLRENKALRAVLNGGFQPGTPVLRAKQSYDVFCPKAFTGIAETELPLTKATLTRCVQLPMRRRARHDEHIAPFRLRRALDETACLREALTTWAQLAVETLGQAEPSMPAGLSDRQQDMWSPLFAIADYIGLDWPQRARQWAARLTAARVSDPDPGVQILADCKRVLDVYAGDRIPTSNLASLRNALPNREYDADLDARKLSKRLQGFGIHPERSGFRMGGRDSVVQRGFAVRQGGAYTRAWRDAFKRYGLSHMYHMQLDHRTADE